MDSTSYINRHRYYSEYYKNKLVIENIALKLDILINFIPEKDSKWITI